MHQEYLISTIHQDIDLYPPYIGYTSPYTRHYTKASGVIFGNKVSDWPKMWHIRVFFRSHFSIFWLSVPKSTEIWSEKSQICPILCQSDTIWWAKMYWNPLTSFLTNSLSSLPSVGPVRGVGHRKWWRHGTLVHGGQPASLWAQEDVRREEADVTRQLVLEHQRDRSLRAAVRFADGDPRGGGVQQHPRQ